MRVIKTVLAFGFFLSVFTSCSTLSLTSEQAIQEFSKINDKTVFEYYDFRLGLISALGHGKQFNNGLKTIYAFNKDNKKCLVTVDEKTTLRLTTNTGRKINLYFDTSFLKDSCIYGNKSHFIDLPAGPFKLDDLDKIEIQTTSDKVKVVE